MVGTKAMVILGLPGRQVEVISWIKETFEYVITCIMLPDGVTPNQVRVRITYLLSQNQHDSDG